MSNNLYSHIDGRRDLVIDDKLSSISKDLEAVVFDLDGTLTDSIGNILKFAPSC